MKYFLDFDLPEQLIATSPSLTRDGDKMMIFQEGQLTHEQFININNYLKDDDIIVFNNSKVFKARLTISALKNDFQSELLLINQENATIWTAMIKKAKRFKIGDSFCLSNGIKAKVIEVLEDGLRRIEFENNFSPIDADIIGQIPLPPYIIEERKKRGEVLYSSTDEERYQTLFAKYYGSVAAPTASLRFSKEMIDKLTTRGISLKEITLHVGPGTFKPMTGDPDDYQIHKEFVTVDADLINFLKQAKKQGRRIIAAGTTVCRALESADDNGFNGWTDIFIKPGYQFKFVDGLITNFHLPQSTLLLLVQAFIGIDNTKKIYNEALVEKYRFFSYGDGMLLFKNTLKEG